MLASTDLDGSSAPWLRVAASARRHWRLLLLTPLAAAAIGFGGAQLVPKTYLAKTTVLPPQPAQSGAAAALSSLGALAGLGGAAAGMRTPGDQYGAFLQSVTILDRIVGRFDLMKVYEVDYRVDARDKLRERLGVTVGKKDGLIAVEVRDRDAKRSADIANAFVEELRSFTSSLAVTEAQQRRLFFEQQMTASRKRLDEAQAALQASGFSLGALRTEPRSAADSYARLRAEITATEVRLQSLRSSFSDNAPEIRQAVTALAAMRSQLAQLEADSGPSRDGGYVSRYRDYKYEETLFELFARQYEIAKVDESREGGLIQVVDPATPPEKEVSPRPLRIAAACAALAVLACLAWVAFASARRRG